jgi:hypothetical protein
VVIAWCRQLPNALAAAVPPRMTTPDRTLLEESPGLCVTLAPAVEPLLSTGRVTAAVVSAVAKLALSTPTA